MSANASITYLASTTLSLIQSNCPTGYSRSTPDLCTACATTSTPALRFIQPLAAFLGGIFCVALVFTCIAHCFRKRGLSTVTLSSSAASAVRALMWAWVHAQPVASAFFVVRQFAPHALLGGFTGVTALQFAGISSPRACSNAPPFLDVWVGVTASSISAIAFALGLSLHGSIHPSLEPFTDALIGLGAFVVTVGHGALVNTFASALVCTESAPVPVSTYITLAGIDGSALTSIGLSPSSLASLKNFASQGIASPLLSQAVSVSVLASDTGVACGELGRSASTAAAVCIALVGAGIPLLSFFAHFRVHGVLPSANRRVSESGPTLKMFAFAFEDSSMEPSAGWLWPLQQATVAVSAAAVSLCTYATADETTWWFALSGAGLAVFVAAVLLVIYQPYRGRYAWRVRADMALLFLALCTLSAAAVLRVNRLGLLGAPDVDATQSAICIALLATAGAVALGVSVGFAHEFFTEAHEEWTATIKGTTTLAAMQTNNVGATAVSGVAAIALASSQPAAPVTSQTLAPNGNDQVFDIVSPLASASARFSAASRSSRLIAPDAARSPPQAPYAALPRPPWERAHTNSATTLSTPP